MNEKGTANKYATPSTRAEPTEYQKAKATANFFSDIAKGAFFVGEFTGFPGFGFVGSIAGALSYSVNPDNNLNDHFNQATSNGIDLYNNTKR